MTDNDAYEELLHIINTELSEEGCPVASHEWHNPAKAIEIGLEIARAQGRYSREADLTIERQRTAALQTQLDTLQHGYEEKAHMSREWSAMAGRLVMERDALRQQVQRYERASQAAKVWWRWTLDRLSASNNHVGSASGWHEFAKFEVALAQEAHTDG